MSKTTETLAPVLAEWLLAELPHIMASGALYFAENANEFSGSQKSLYEHFIGNADSYMQYRANFELPELAAQIEAALS